MMFNQVEFLLFVKLIIAHLITDFVLQKKSWVSDKQKYKTSSSKLYLHAAIAAMVAYILSGEWTSWWLPLYIFTSHLAIAVWKVYQQNKVVYFVIDQLLHLFSLTLLVLIWSGGWYEIPMLLKSLFHNIDFLLITAGYLTVTYPLGIFIGQLTQKWQVESQTKTNGLAEAGIWIGLLERFLIFTFILIQQYTAIGFLIAAKSILRYNDKDFNTQKQTEYVLIGTLMSFASAIILGLLIKSFVDYY